jgi:micrococcal nuclease
MLFALTAAAAIAVCPPPPARRFHCVHDGDTVWWQGEKIRISGIDAPELNGRCPAERRRAITARNRLVVMINAGPVTIDLNGADRFGRTLASLGGIGDQLVNEVLASRWPKRKDWCA